MLGGPGVCVGGTGLLLQALAEPVSHFGGGGFSEGDDEDFGELRRSGLVEQALEAALDQSAGFASAGAGDDNDVAASGHGGGLGRGERHLRTLYSWVHGSTRQIER